MSKILKYVLLTLGMGLAGAAATIGEAICAVKLESAVRDSEDDDEDEEEDDED